jgi:hypothetical protein
LDEFSKLNADIRTAHAEVVLLREEAACVFTVIQEFYNFSAQLKGLYEGTTCAIQDRDRVHGNENIVLLEHQWSRHLEIVQTLYPELAQAKKASEKR